MTDVRKRTQRGMFLLPSAFTAVNIALGYFAITQSLQGTPAEPWHFDFAALAIGFAIPFDAIDGRIARMTGTESDFGRELDSLADVITFGVAPSILAYVWGVSALPAMQNAALRQHLVELGAFVCFLFLICGAARLARFNVSVNPQPRNPGRSDRKYFVGMPIPAGAGVIAAVIHFFKGSPVDNGWVALLWMSFVGFTGFLMVSRWRFWSGKEIKLDNSHPFRLMVLLAVVIALVWKFSQWTLILFGLSYMVSGILARLAYQWSRDRQKPSLAQADVETSSPHIL